MNEGNPTGVNTPAFNGGVYSNIQIKQAIADGHIVFHPYTPEHIAGSSVDVTLGHWFYRTERGPSGGFYNPFDEADVNRYFDGPYHAEVHELWAQANGRKLFAGIPADHPIIVLRPVEPHLIDCLEHRLLECQLPRYFEKMNPAHFERQFYPD
jgi:hypothetical protein